MHLRMMFNISESVLHLFLVFQLDSQLLRAGVRTIKRVRASHRNSTALQACGNQINQEITFLTFVMVMSLILLLCRRYKLELSVIYSKLMLAYIIYIFNINMIQKPYSIVEIITSFKLQNMFQRRESGGCSSHLHLLYLCLTANTISIILNNITQDSQH